MPFGKNIKSSYPPPTSYELIVSLLFFYKDGVGIKLPTKVDMPLNKESKAKHFRPVFMGQFMISSSKHSYKHCISGVFHRHPPPHITNHFLEVFFLVGGCYLSSFHVSLYIHLTITFPVSSHLIFMVHVFFFLSV